MAKQTQEQVHAAADKMAATLASKVMSAGVPITHAACKAVITELSTMLYKSLVKKGNVSQQLMQIGQTNHKNKNHEK